MNWQEALTQIESPEFDANVNVVSGNKAFFRAIDKEQSVREAHRLLKESGDLQEDALGRILDLTLAEIDPLYENPHDTPLAVLLWLTYYAAPEFAQIAAQYVSRAPHCWYANKLANSILFPGPNETGNDWVEVGTKGLVVSNNTSEATDYNMTEASVKLRYFSGVADGRSHAVDHEQNVGALS